ncbi:rhombosortase [Thalassotalea insulae]|uniref:Rhombosortase n=1 Tax=Thalassotalea insulae TaxID=2056778 RepID=A0ABQ6GZN7_9GAMM|nr:rhombosortase [Thalassotalea insulae]GLX80071.1 rhombosortase [Thalassotalea insulae]
MLKIKQLPINTTHISGPVLLLILTVFCYFFNENFSQYFVYNRPLIIEHQYWRLITAHIFHTNYAHLLLNALAVILLWLIHGHYYSLFQYLSLTLISALIISISIFIFDPEMLQYVGLSGVLHALFVWGALKDITAKEKTGYLLLIGVIVKIAHEQFFGASEDIASLINASVAINAHLSGALVGLGYYFIPKIGKKFIH